ncbi:MAG: FAD-dependent monooxygenase [Myxococcaceae bacterium]
MDYADVVIAGGGPAGVATAAALAQAGYTVLIVDAGADRTKQLAGELLHPPGVADLEALGFGQAVASIEARPVKGFAVIDGVGTHEDGAQTQLLPYSELPGPSGQGIAFDHAKLCEALLAEVERRPRVKLWNKSRVTGIVQNDAESVVVVVQRKDGSSTQVSAKLLVAADGRASGVRKMAGIEEDKKLLSSMAGYLVDSALLPHPGFGHVFVGGRAPVLAYEIAPGTARVMVDIPEGGQGIDAPKKDPSYLAALPPALREAVQTVVHTHRAVVAASFTRKPQFAAKGRVALVGDAAGCCHPVSASGLSSCTRDALELRRALQESPDDIHQALSRYSVWRKGPQRTRISLAAALYQAFSENSPEMNFLRRGLFRYWRRSKAGRRTSMALLSTREMRVGVMAREYARVVSFALPRLMVDSSKSWSALQNGRRALTGLVRSTLPHVGETVRQAIDTLGRRRRSESGSKSV